jgi:hypothetical protein|tara:strand:- start:3586 stop:4467 length:882 start_codon:yes stop_codon:yes gene_type:complete
MSDSLLNLLEIFNEVLEEGFPIGADLEKAKNHLTGPRREKARNWLQKNFEKIEAMLMSTPFALGTGRDSNYVKIRPKSKEDSAQLYLKFKDDKVAGLKIGRGSTDGPTRGAKSEKQLLDLFASFRDAEIDEKEFFDFVNNAKPGQPGPDLSLGFRSPDGSVDAYVDIEIKHRLGSNAEFIQIATLPKSFVKYDEDSPQKKIRELYRKGKAASSEEVKGQLKRKFSDIDLFYIADRFYTPEVVFDDPGSVFEYVKREATKSGRKGPRLNVCLYSIDKSKGFGEEDLGKLGKFFE